VFQILAMKRRTIHTWAVVGVSMLMAAAVFRAMANDASANATTAKSDKAWTGTVVSVAPNERVLDVKGFLFRKQFNLGDSCRYDMVGQEQGTIGDLRPGQRITVSYQNANGVLVADRVTQEPLRETGMVKSVDPNAHLLTLHVGMMDKTYQLPESCGVMLRGDKAGALGDIRVGDHVTVTYEVPGGQPVARDIAQTSARFTGNLTAIDLGQKVLKAKGSFGSKKFNVGDDCAIVINGQPDGKLIDLRPGENLTFNYDTVNGVNIVNRIAPARATPARPTTAMQLPPE